MSKINSTYSSGYYIAPDVDLRKLEEQQRQEQRGKRRRAGDKAGASSSPGGGDGDDNVKRQTFAIPFDLICLHCQRRIARGSHVYTNRRSTEERYMDSIQVWELEILCRFCKGKYYLRTDPATPKETGGYICGTGCRRVEGDFYALNKENEATRAEWEKAKAEAELDPLATLERENAAARALEERNRRIEEEVEALAGHEDESLLEMLRGRPRRTAARTALLSDSDGEEDPPPPGSGREQATAVEGNASSMDGLPTVVVRKKVRRRKIGSDSEEEDVMSEEDEEDADAEDADAQVHGAFARETERRWRALQREQRAQRQHAKDTLTTTTVTTAATAEVELQRVLARYTVARSTSVAGAVGLERSGTAPGVGTRSRTTGDEEDEGERERNGAMPLISVPTLATASGSHTNKFFLAMGDGEDEEEEEEETALPGRVEGGPVGPSVLRRGSSPPKVAVSTCLRGVPEHPTSVVTGRPTGSTLLRNLVGSDSDDDSA